MIGTKSMAVEETEKIVLIDADSLLYFSSYGSEQDQMLSELKLSEKIYDILNIVEQSYNIKTYHIFVKGKDNFRYKIFSEYKKNRPAKHPIIDILSHYLVDQFGAIEAHGAESDDYVYTYSQIPEYVDKCIICSVDKDMRQIPGIHYDYQKNKFITVSDEDAKYNFAIQMIMGDAADGIPCLKGYGIKKAEKIVKKGMTLYQYKKAILQEYKKNCLNYQEAKEQIKLNYKLLKLQKIDN